MKIMVLGGGGRAGQAIVQEAVKRHHDVTVVTRDARSSQARVPAGVAVLERAPLALTPEDVAGYDAVVDAVGIPWGSGHGYLHLDIAAHVIALLRGQKTRAVFILGSASLAMPGQDHPAIEDFPEVAASQPWYDGARYQYYEWQYLRWVDNVDWVAFSPGEAFMTGPASGYQLGADTLLLDATGQSHVTTGNMALAILDQLEQPTAHQKRLAVADQ